MIYYYAINIIPNILALYIGSKLNLENVLNNILIFSAYGCMIINFIILMFFKKIAVKPIKNTNELDKINDTVFRLDSLRQLSCFFSLSLLFFLYLINMNF
mgnify:CR=1 FL=1|tara:strand:+ start:2789 stop:3088 length:300 start_codon:yes stop_codon:yes gene_type:complete